MTHFYPEQKPGIKTHYIGGETLLIDDDEQFAVNPPAAYVWKLCDGAHTVEDIKRAVRDHFGVAAETELDRDIIQILNNFSENHLLVKQLPQCDESHGAVNA